MYELVLLICYILCFESFYFLLPLFRSLMYGIILDKKKLKILFCVQKCTGIYMLNCLHKKIVLLVVGDLTFLMFPTSDDFTALWDFHWIRIASPSPGNWLTVRSWILMKFFSFDENWSLVIWRFFVEFFLRMSPYTIVDEDLEC